MAKQSVTAVFQWAPTLGGECYYLLCSFWSAGYSRTQCFNGHPPLGVNATEIYIADAKVVAKLKRVSMGTHPWG